MTSLADQRKQAEKEGLIGSSDIFKVKDGQNRIRIVSYALPHPGEFKGKRNFKWLVYIIDRADGKLKPYFMPHKIFKTLESFQEDEDYAFDELVDMPYDIVINVKGAGTIDVEYAVIARKPTELTPAEETMIAEAKPLEELQQQIRAKAGGTSKTVEPRDDDHAGFDPDEIPF